MTIMDKVYIVINHYFDGSSCIDSVYHTEVDANKRKTFIEDTNTESEYSYTSIESEFVN